MYNITILIYINVINTVISITIIYPLLLRYGFICFTPGFVLFLSNTLRNISDTIMLTVKIIIAFTNPI